MFTRSKIAAAVVFSASLIVFASSQASAVTKKKVRALSTSELRSAQRRLIEMGYPSGPMGVMTFQKWEGRKVSSRLTRADYEAVMNASAPQAKDADYGHV